MMNQYPLWKYLLLVFVLLVGVIYALPNVYGEDPALQISGGRSATVDTVAHDKVIAALQTADIPVKATELKPGQLDPSVRVARPRYHRQRDPPAPQELRHDQQRQ